MDTHEFREVGHRMVDLLSEYLEHIEERPLFADVEPAKLNKLFAEPLPQNPSSSDEVLQQIQEKLLPYCTHVGHPGYFGLITPSPNLMGILGTSFAPRSTKTSERTRLGHRRLLWS